MLKLKVTFDEIRIPLSYGAPKFGIFHVIVNGRPKVMEIFDGLQETEKKRIKRLIGFMATQPDFKSDDLRWQLKNYQYGELKPRHHRFFFFISYRNNIVFFDYLEKKKGSVSDEHYESINKKRIFYEQEFRRYIEKNS